jgi:hypothetical protein
LRGAALGLAGISGTALMRVVGCLARSVKMAGERVKQRSRKAGGVKIVKKKANKFARHQSDQFMRVPVRTAAARGLAWRLRAPLARRLADL